MSGIYDVFCSFLLILGLRGIWVTVINNKNPHGLIKKKLN